MRSLNLYVIKLCFSSLLVLQKELGYFHFNFHYVTVIDLFFDSFIFVGPFIYFAFLISKSILSLFLKILSIVNFYTSVCFIEKGSGEQHVEVVKWVILLFPKMKELVC